MEKELDWNHEPGDILVTDDGDLLVVSTEGFEKHFLQGTHFLLVRVGTGEIEACINRDELQELWRYYVIRDIKKNKI